MLSNKMYRIEIEKLRSLIGKDNEAIWYTPAEIQFSRPVSEQALENQLFNKRIASGELDPVKWETDEEIVVEYYLWFFEKEDFANVTLQDLEKYIVSIHSLARMFCSTFPFSMTIYPISQIVPESLNADIISKLRRLNQIPDPHVASEWESYLHELAS